MAKSPTQKAKLMLKAIELLLTTDVTNDYYLQPKTQKCLSLSDLAREVAALSTRQEDPEEIARTTTLVMERMMWFLSAGYSISTPLGYFHTTAQGVFLEGELNTGIDRSRLKLGISYAMSAGMRQSLAQAEIDVDIQKSVAGPQLYAVVSAQDAQNPAFATRGEGIPISAGQTCIIKGRNLKVGGTDEKIGVTLTSQATDHKETFFFPLTKLYPNTATQVGFVMPASVEDGSVWSVSLCTQIGGNSNLLKAPRTVEMGEYFIVGASNPGGSPNPTPDGEDQNENPLG